MVSNIPQCSSGGTAPDLADDFAFAVCLLVQESYVARQIAKSTQSQEASLCSSKLCLPLIVDLFIVASLSQNRTQDELQLLAGQAVWLIAEHQLVCMQWACLGVPLDDIVGSGTQVKHRLALGIKQHSFGWHEACHQNKEAAVR